VGATRLFRDLQFDGPPLVVPTIETVDEGGEVLDETESEDDEDEAAEAESHIAVEEPEPQFQPGGSGELSDPHPPEPLAKFELHGVPVTLEHEGFYVHDTTTGRPRLVRYIDWTRQVILDNFDDPAALLAQWANTTDGPA
jgi:hypothetical protein